MHRYKLVVEYFGPFFKGFQRQANLLTVQGCLEHALFLLTQEQQPFICAGRTDTGVHAVSQVVHVNLLKEFDPYRLYRGMNHFLSLHYKSTYLYPLRVKEVARVDHTFHARASAKKRTYLYRIKRSCPSVFDHLRAFEFFKHLDLDKMHEASKHFIGKHNFSCFRSSECQAKTPIKTISRCEIEEKKDELYIWIEAQSFLHHQVRLMVGCLIDVGRERIAPSDVVDFLEQAQPFQNQFFMAPAYGLYFYDVLYDVA